ncbi:4Fe-4S binding protein [Adlercreutzia agrestimuris]|uniref:4Fe-4S binding protein n=1 Tax=Adlercreutzia agrestimuris TaxID=2941324 RepID=UPI00203DEEBA|nr:4Fe-4S binding protein [Adlercreutzia agrestimuris]
MKTKNLRTAIAVGIFVVLAAGLIFGVSFGTLSGFGWDDFSVLCPLGALGTMIATKTMIPRAVVSLVAMILFFVVLGRAFCAWACPVGVFDRIRAFFRSPKKRKEIEQAKHDEMLAISRQELEARGVAVKNAEHADAQCTHSCKTCGGCQPFKHGKLDSRHAVLGGALLSTAIFGFPVFCLVCPVGLTFATVLVVWRLFSAGDMTWSVILIPAFLIVELVLLRKWCTRFCPLAGLMNLFSRFSKTWVPTIDDSKCLETAKESACGRCAMACEADINIRHPEFGERTMADCTRCRACIDACPTKAISMPFLVRAGHKVTLADAEQDVLEGIQGAERRAEAAFSPLDKAGE